MKKIMILGAGIYQVPLIKKAKEMGLFTIVVSVKGNYPGFEYADEVVYEDTTDTENILRIAREKQIDGIVTTGTDVAVITIGRVCDSLGLHGVSEEGAKIACDKMLMKKAYMDNEVNTAEFYYADLSSDVNSYIEISNRIGYPVIFKAVDSSGSRGITRVNSEEDIDEAVNAIKKITHQEKFIIEKYLEGEEFGAQAFVQNGKIEFVLPHGDYVFKGDAGVPIGHYAPFDINGLDEEILEQTQKAIKAMNLDNCAINADFILYNGHVFVLEIGARGGATQLVELVSLYYGFDYYQKMIQVALGDDVSFEPENNTRVPNASHLLMAEKDGVIKKIDNKVLISNGVVDVSLDYKVGDRVRKFHVGPDRIGHIITKGDTLESAQKLLFQQMENIKIYVE